MTRKIEWKNGDKVTVTDPDGATWDGKVAGPSVLWKGWWMVRPDVGAGRLGKVGVYHVHAAEMEDR